MIKESVSLDEVIEFLNELVEIDKDCIENLIKNRVLCNNKMRDHDTVQVGCFPDLSVGFLGVLNGLFGVFDDGPKEYWGAICYDDRGKFARTKNEW